MYINYNVIMKFLFVIIIITKLAELACNGALKVAIITHNIINNFVQHIKWLLVIPILFSLSMIIVAFQMIKIVMTI